MVTAHRQPDGSTAVNVPTEKKSATGPLLWVAHYKEFKEHDKREKRGGNAVSGSSLGALSPTAYDISAGVDTTDITARQQLKRQIAQELGVDSENWRVAEVLRARDHGPGPYGKAYPHTHERPLEAYKLAVHLCYAHGASVYTEPATAVLVTAIDAATHAALHIEMTRRQDPGYAEASETDWHEADGFEV